MDFFEMDELNVQLVAAGLPLRVVTVKIEEGMSELGRVIATVANPTDIDFEPLLDQPAALVITSGLLPIRSFELRLAKARFKGVVDQSLRWELEFHHPLHFLSFRRNVRKFRDQTTEAIVSKVLGEAGIKHEWNNTRPCASRPYTVQYREFDLDFVKRLLEFEGVYFTFEDDGTLMLGDASGSMPQLGVFDLVETESAVSERPGITSWKKGARFGSGAATVSDYNWKTPSLSLLASSKSEHDPQFETYDYPVGYRDQATGRTLAQLRKEALVAMKRYAEGLSSVVQFRPGRIFEFFHSEAVAFSGTFLLVSVEHTFVTNLTGGKSKYGNRFVCIPAEVPFRPALTTPRPVITGNHTAMVRGPSGEEIHTDIHGRAKVQFHWDREASGLDDSRWIRVLQETSSSIVLSRVGWESSVGYIDGDPDRPIGLGRQINGQMTPTYSQPNFKARMTIKSETYPGKEGFNELRMEDSAGKMFMDWHAQKDWQAHVGNDKTETIGNNYTHLVTSTLGRTVEKNQTLKVGADETKTVGKDYAETVGKDRSETIKGSEKINVKNNHTFDCSADDSEEVGGNRTSFVGSVSVDSPPAPDLMASLVPSSAKGFSDAMNDQAVQKVMGSQTAGDYTGGVGSRGFEGPSGAGAPPSLADGGPADASSAMSTVSPSTEGALNPGDGNTAAASNYKGMIQRSVGADFKKTVQSSYMKLAGLQIANDVGLKSIETVKGTKRTTAMEQNITQSCAGDFKRTVKGNINREAKGRVTTSSKQSSIVVDVDMKLKSEEKIEIRGKEIDITAQDKFRLECTDGCSGIVIELTPETITIEGDMKVAATDTIEIDGYESFTR